MTWDPLERPYLYSHLIDTAQVSTTGGVLHFVTINRPDVGDGALVTVYDVATADDIAADRMVANITMDDAFYVVPVTLSYNVRLDYGLYVLFSQGMTTGDITVAYLDHANM